MQVILIFLLEVALMDKIKRAICQIISGEDILGTGFYIGNGKIITARHVVDRKEELEVHFLEIEKAVISYLCQKVIRLETDLAILTIEDDEKLKDIYLLCNMNRIIMHSSFVSYGYPGNNFCELSRICGTIINSHDGVEISQYNLELNITEGELSNYSGMSGAPLIVDGQVYGILVYQSGYQLRAIEFNRVANELETVIRVQDDNHVICNVETHVKLDNYIQDYKLVNELYKLVLSDEAPGVIFVEGNNGSGKTLWIEHLSSYGCLCVIGKYYLGHTLDSEPVIYRKSEEILYEWLIKIVSVYAESRIGRLNDNSYVKRVQEVSKILDILNMSMKEMNKHAILCLDGIDEFSCDEQNENERFCSYFAGNRRTHVHFIVSTNNAKNLAKCLQKARNEKNVLHKNKLGKIQVRWYLKEHLAIALSSEIVDRLVDKVDGNPLYMQYLIKTINEFSHDDITELINELPDYSGEIEQYYDYIWQSISQQDSYVKYLAWYARVRFAVTKSQFLNMVPVEERISFDKAASALNNLVVDYEKMTFFHNSFRNYIIGRTLYLDQNIHHELGNYCIIHEDEMYAVANCLYHLRLGNQKDVTQSFVLCNQDWINRCASLSISPEIMQADMEAELSICCNQGKLSEVIRILLLMQRADYRYNDMFIRYAYLIGMAEIAIGYPDKVLYYIRRQNVWLVDFDEIWCIFEELLQHQFYEQAMQLCDEVETDILRHFSDENSGSLESISLLIHMYSGLAEVDAETSHHKLYTLYKLIYSMEQEEGILDGINMSAGDYILWKYGRAVDDEKLKQGGINVSQRVYDNWILSMAGAVDLERLSGIAIQSDEEVVSLIEKYWDLFQWDNRFQKIFNRIYVEKGRNYEQIKARILTGQYDSESNSVRNANGVDVDYEKLYSMFYYYRNQAYADAQNYKTIHITNVESDWEKSFLDILRGIGVFYGTALKCSVNNDTEKLTEITCDFKRFLCDVWPSFEKRVTLKDTYKIPESVLEVAMQFVSRYFSIMVREELPWFFQFILDRVDEQLGVYHEAYFRMLLNIITTFRCYSADVELIIPLLQKLYEDIKIKEMNRYDRTELLLKLVTNFEKAGCIELAKNAYKEMLNSSMGPGWYKEGQFYLIDQAISLLNTEYIDLLKSSECMAILDNASGGMTFERYVRTAKESLIVTLWKKEKYNLVYGFIQKQIIPRFEECIPLVEVEKADLLRGRFGNTRVCNCIFWEGIMSEIVKDNILSDKMRWAISEVFLLCDFDRYSEEFVKVQSTIFATSRKNKSCYIERLLNILVCDAGERYYSKLINLYKQHMTDEDYDLLLEALDYIDFRKENTGLDSIDIHSGHNQDRDIADEDFIRLEGIWGNHQSLEAADSLWRVVESEEKHFNIQKAIIQCKDILVMIESEGWDIWKENVAEIVDKCFEKIFILTEDYRNALEVLRELIVHPKYGNRWDIVHKLLTLINGKISPENQSELYKEIMDHYHQLIPVSSVLMQRYSDMDIVFQNPEVVMFRLLFLCAVSYDPLIEEKAIELLTWLVLEDTSYDEILLELCFEKDIDQAEMASSFCLKISSSSRIGWKEKIKKHLSIGKLEKIEYFVVLGNLYYAMEKCRIGEELLSYTYQLIREHFFCTEESQAHFDMNDIQKSWEASMPCYVWEEIEEYSKENFYQQFLLDVLSADFQEIQDLYDYAVMLTDGFHNRSAGDRGIQKRLYQALNIQKYKFKDKAAMEKLLSSLRRVNLGFPLPSAHDYLGTEKTVCALESVILRHDDSAINYLYNKNKAILGFMAIKTGKYSYTFEIRTFVIPVDLDIETCVNEIFNKRKDSYHVYSPNVAFDKKGVNELTIPYMFGNIVGYRLSNVIINRKIILELGINNNKIKYHYYSGNRSEEFFDMPTLISTSADIDTSNFQLPESMKLIYFLARRNESKEQSQYAIIDTIQKQVFYI